jgi:23S rRNA (cytosine1962-C5)-methyltransferase
MPGFWHHARTQFWPVAVLDSNLTKLRSIMSTVTVNKRGADRIRGGHLWIYRSDVVQVGAGGSVVVVRDQKGNFVGQAFFSDSSQIALRFLSQTEEPIDREWWRRRILAAANRRANIAANTNAFRLVYTEGDLLPSLIIDRYDDVLVLQTLSQGSDAIKPLLVELLVEQFAPRAIIERNDVRVRQHEGLRMIAGTLYGEAPAEFEIRRVLGFWSLRFPVKRPDRFLISARIA